MSRDGTRGNGGNEGRGGDDRFLQLAAYLPDYVNLVDRDRRFRWTNRLAPGLTWDMVEGTQVDQWVTPESLAEAVEAIERCFETGEQTSYRVVAYGDGVALAHYENRVVPGAPRDGTPHVLILTRDVTDQVRAAQQLRSSEHRLARAVSAGRIGLWEYDPRTGLTTRDAWLAGALGFPARDTDRKAWLDRLHPDDRNRVDAWFDALTDKRTDASEIEYRVQTPQGGVHWVIDRGAWHQSEPDAEIVAGVTLDVTDLRRLERERRDLARQLEQAQRLESIGQLAGGIAHDFNNLLMVIQTAAEMAETLLDEGGDVREDLRRIDLAAERAATLTSKLLAFGRRTALDVQPLDLRTVVSSVRDLVARLLPETITIRVELPEEAIVIDGDQRQLEQAVLNLCINARDAMAGGGSLRLSLSRAVDQVDLMVADTGEGIPAEHLGRIFEPFFTTKPVGSGTGLGLAMVHGIVQQHRGTIQVDSTAGSGTAVRIQLPLSSAPTGALGVPRATPPSGRGRILVAEDEEMIVDLLEKLLTRAGFEVVSAYDGQEALDLWETHEGRFDLVLLDAVMPRLDGWKTYERLRALDREVPILFSSGYAAAAIPGRFDTDDAPPLLSKPYKASVLLRAIADAIGHRRSGRGTGDDG